MLSELIGFPKRSSTWRTTPEENAFPAAKSVGWPINAICDEALGLTVKLPEIRLIPPKLAVSVGSPDPSGCDIVINATPLGMKKDDPLPMNVDLIAASTFVGEVVMKEEITPFLAAVRARGCDYQIGTDMLFEQIPAYLEFFGFDTATSDELREVAQIRY